MLAYVMSHIKSIGLIHEFQNWPELPELAKQTLLSMLFVVLLFTRNTTCKSTLNYIFCY